MQATHHEDARSQRWGDLLALAADLAFETDRWGRFLFLAPSTALGWSAGAMLGKSAELLLASPGSIAGFNPFRAAIPVRGRRAWLNRAGGGQACLRFTCVPLLDADAVPVGTRGIGLLETEADVPRAWGPEVAIDRLTGLTNRRGFETELSRRLARLDRNRLPSTLLWANLDGFRVLNERLGPALGEQLLGRVAALISATVRPTDLVGHVGGDSFAVWLSGADHMTAAERAEALRLAIPEAVVPLIGPSPSRLGISIGIAAHSLDGDETADMLMRRAQRAMAAVKHGGKGHWRVAQIPTP